MFARPAIIHFIEISRLSIHDALNYSDAPTNLKNIELPFDFPGVVNSWAQLVPSPQAYAQSGAI